MDSSCTKILIQVRFLFAVRKVLAPLLTCINAKESYSMYRNSKTKALNDWRIVTHYSTACVYYFALNEEWYELESRDSFVLLRKHWVWNVIFLSNNVLRQHAVDCWLQSWHYGRTGRKIQSWIAKQRRSYHQERHVKNYINALSQHLIWHYWSSWHFCSISYEIHCINLPQGELLKRYAIITCYFARFMILIWC